MRAWYAYWATFVVGLVIWFGVLVLGGRDGFRSMLGSSLGLTILILPMVAAGINLILYRRSHEEVCRLEIERHRFLRLVAGSGYSASVFAATGAALIALAVVILAAQLTSL